MTRDGDDTGRRIASRRGFLGGGRRTRHRRARGVWRSASGCRGGRGERGHRRDGPTAGRGVVRKRLYGRGDGSPVHVPANDDRPRRAGRADHGVHDPVSPPAARRGHAGRSVGAPRGLGVADAGHGSERPRPVAPGNRGNPTGDHLRQLGAQPPAHLPRPRAQQGLDGRRRPDDDGPAGRARRGVYLRD